MKWQLKIFFHSPVTKKLRSWKGKEEEKERKRKKERKRERERGRERGREGKRKEGIKGHNIKH